MPVFNAEPYVVEAVQSVLTQTGVSFALLAIDDGSTDGSLELLQTLAADVANMTVLVNDVNVGITATLNRAVQLVESEFLLVFAADDVMMMGLIAAAVEALRTFGRECAAVSIPCFMGDGDAKCIVDNNGEPMVHGLADRDVHLLEPTTLFARLLRGNFLSGVGLHRTSVLRELGYDLVAIEDWPMWCRLAERYRSPSALSRCLYTGTLPTA